MKNHVRASLNEAQKALDSLLADEAMLEKIAEAGALLATTLGGDGRVFSCGNGGSMCDAMHFAEELSGRYRLERRALAATAISDPSHLSCVANDYSYEQVFARYLEAHARSGDCLLAISTSGTSKNVLAAAYAARERGVLIIALTGKPDTPLSRIATIDLCTPGGRFADRVQELHIKLIHILIELVERQLFGETYP